MTGRNEQIAQHLAKYLTEKGATVTLEQMLETDAYTLPNYDAVIVETFTYGDGEVPDEAQDFFADLQDLDLDRTKFAVLGSSSKTHLHFGRAVDYFTMQLNSSNGEQVADSVKIDRDPDEDDWARVERLGDYVIKAGTES